MRKLFLSVALLLAACGRSAPGASESASSPTPEPTATATALPATFVSDPRIDDVADFDALQNALPTAADAQARVNQYWSALDAHGAPAHANGRVVFSLRDANDGWYVAGSFNGWSTTANPLTRIAGTDTLVADVAVPAGTRVSYKFVNNGYWTRDPDAPWVEFDGIDTGTIGEFNSVTFAGATTPFGMSEIYRFSAHATALDNDRDVFVQIPDGYFPARAALPLLVMHDGNEDLCRGRFDAVLDTARMQAQAPDILIAYVALHDQNERMAEYTFGTTGARGLDYEAFVADELVPALESRFHTPQTAASRGIIGASLGGLISYRIGFDRPDVFSRVGGQSSSFFWNSNEMITDIQNAPMEGGRWYLDAGSDADNGDVALMMKDVLDSKGYVNDYVRDPNGQHDWSYWAPRLPGAVQFLFTN